MKTEFSKVLLGLAFLLGSQGIAQAAPISCSSGIYDVSNKVQGTSDCERLAVPANGETLNDDNDTVNAAAFFGIDSWTREGKYDNVGANGGLDASNLFNFTGNNMEGSYSYVGPSPGPVSIMLVFKDGRDTNLVAYLLSVPYGSDLDYASPFIPGLFDVNETKEISHISVYVSGERPDGEGGSNEIPEPASLGIVGLGLGLLGLARRRRT